VALLEILHDDANMGTWCSRSRSLDFVILNYAGLIVSFRFVLAREIEAIELMIEQHLFVLVMKSFCFTMGRLTKEGKLTDYLALHILF